MTLSFKKVSLSFDKNHDLLSAINLEVRENELVVLAGKNGAGKSLLLRLALGLEKATKGEILYNGRPVATCLRELRLQIGLVAQESERHILCQTVREEFFFGPENNGYSKEETEKTLAELEFFLSLSQKMNDYPFFLSGGERRRLAIASVLASRPSIIFFDEPFLSLDYLSEKEFIRLVFQLRKAGKGIVIVTHAYEKIIDFADRLILLSGGSILADGKPSDILHLCAHAGLRPFLSKK